MIGAHRGLNFFTAVSEHLARNKVAQDLHRCFLDRARAELFAVPFALYDVGDARFDHEVVALRV